MIYLDHAATSPLRPEVREAVLPWLGPPANPSSPHRAGQAAAAAVERAREQVAALVGGDPAGVVFTSGATEANHLFLRGALRRGGGLVLSPLEHPSVQAAAGLLAEAGVAVHRLPVGAGGAVELPAALPEGASVLSVMAANHETGVLQPVEAARRLADAAGAALHVDATQAAGRVPLGVTADGLALSGHKLGGPPGVGALVLRDGGPFPALFPGSQERGRRAGTVPTALVVGLGVACALAARELEVEAARQEALRARLERGLQALGARVVGGDVPRVPGITCAVVPGLRGEALVQALDLRGVCVSAGAACASGSLEPSPALVAMGDPEPAGILRVSLGPTSTEAHVDALLTALPEVLGALRAASAWEVPPETARPGGPG